MIQFLVSALLICSVLPAAFNVPVKNPFHVTKENIYSVSSKRDVPFEMVTRAEWGAQPPTAVTPMVNPVSYVIIHHSYIPAACYTTDRCKAAMRGMQRFHQHDRGWNDIGYSFAVGSDGKAYEGRGWSAVGAHAPRYNDRSIGVCIIGDWQVELPPKQQLEKVKELIAYGVKQGYIAENYTLLGHRQVRDTICPGPALFTEIQSWPQFSPHPEGPWEVDTMENVVPT